QKIGGEHLLVLAHDGGPREHLATLGASLLRLQERGLFVLVAGGAPCAQLRRTAAASVFSEAPVRHVPALGEAEVPAALHGAGLDGARHARDVLDATGGHPGLLDEVLLGKGALDAAAITERLARSPTLRGALRARLSDDDREAREERRHAR